MQLPRLRRDQHAIAVHPAHIKVVAMGRRWGKTIMAGCLAVGEAYYGAQVAWVVPTYRNARPLWRFVEQHVAQAATIHRSEMAVKFGGGRLGIYTADHDIALRGEAFDLVIVDEAARIREETWTDVIMPTLADCDGRAILVSTPRGHNWFWREYLRGSIDNDRQQSWRAPSANNPSKAIQGAATRAKELVSERTYRQEWLAEFVEDGGGVFRGVRKCVKEHAVTPVAGLTYVIGVDWGRTNDATVFTIIATETMQVVHIAKLLDVDYARQVAQLTHLATIWNPYAIIAETNSMGGPLVESLQRAGLPVEGFATTAQTKLPLIDALALAIERQDIGLTNNIELLAELEAYESERLPSGVVRFSAPQGMHDDHVISLALAYRAARRAGPLVLFEA